MENRNKYNIALLVEYFLSLEKELDLINYSIDGIKVWQYLRTRLFLNLAYKLGIYNQAHTKKTGFKDLIVASPSLLFFSVFSNPLWGKYQRDTLIFNTGRKTKVEGKLIDIYTKYFVDSLEKNSYEIIEEMYENKHLTWEFKNRKHEDYIQVMKIVFTILSRFKFSREQQAFIKKLQFRIQSDLGVELDLVRLFRMGYLYFKYDYSYYLKLLQKRKPKKILLVSAYTNKKAIVAAAKSLGIESVEIQHGVINNHEIGYYYSDNTNVDYFPDKINVFGKFWKDNIKFPIDKENVRVVGFPYLNLQIEKFKYEEKNWSQILIISQGTIGQQLSELVWNGINELKNFQIIYKLHPGEYARWKTDYPYLLKISELSNVEIIDNYNQNLYQHFATSGYILGVYSTALYEALAFDCKVIILNLPGIEFVAELIDQNIAKLANNLSDVRYLIEANDFQDFSSEYFFA